MSRLTYWMDGASANARYFRQVCDELALLRKSRYARGFFVAHQVTDKVIEACWYIARAREYMGMPTNKGKETMWRGFVDVKLTSTEKELFEAWQIHGEDLWVMLCDVIVHGHKYSCTYNKSNDTFVASFTGLEGTHGNEGYTLSAFAHDWYDATRVLCYKHLELLQGDWENAKTRVTDSIG